MKIQIHIEVFDEIKQCIKKWYPSLSEEMPRICRLLIQDGKISGESPYHYIKLPILQGRTFHAGINLPQEKVGKRKGARTIYVKEGFELIKMLYVGGHKDPLYNNSHSLVPLLEKRYQANSFIEYTNGLSFR